eukprot:scaffold116989_cov55-Phaeocystis_antarctica.AAC.1
MGPHRIPCGGSASSRDGRNEPELRPHADITTKGAITKAPRPTIPCPTSFDESRLGSVKRSRMSSRAPSAAAQPGCPESAPSHRLPLAAGGGAAGGMGAGCGECGECGEAWSRTACRRSDAFDAASLCC